MTTFDEMLKYLKALDEDEEIYFCGDHPYCSGTLLSVSNDGQRHYGNLDDEYVDGITISDEEYETIKAEVESNTISYDDSIDDLIEVMAFKKGCRPNKEYYYAAKTTTTTTRRPIINPGFLPIAFHLF